ncbi:amidase domain-containing protein [Staphylococcus capitis]|uniref:amidase domain-containing protein n=1 Tax=Staphylococcus capitis TaxID=29388 RepID=UPI00064B6785|nr:amidase domain-containing protein [Staphylococcus capitis]AKL92953.1 N-acetylmuramoyl-L-alanine amidase domain-containing protein precursor [Staphylococcus capitis subsp. capitis]
MSKNKLLIYLLSTALVFPTFTTPTAVAKDNTDDMNQQTKVAHKSSQSKEDKQEQTDSNQRAHQAEKASSEKSPSKENGKSSKTHNKDNDVKADKNKTSNQSDQNSNHSHQTTTAVTDQNKQKNTNLVDQFYQNVAQSQSHMNDLLKPDKYDNSFSLTTLIQNLFNFDSNISNYEQSDDHTSQSSSASNRDDSTDSDNNDSKEVTSNKNSNSDIPFEGSHSSHSEDQSHQSSTSSSKAETDDSKVSDALSQWEHDDHKNTSQSQGQSSQQDESKQSSNQTHQPSSNQTTSHSSSNNNHSSISNSALDTILDEYSEDAKKTQSNYEQKSKHQKNTSQSSQNNNPQLPTEDELKHKSKPVQSFENDIKKSNTRSTSLFQQVPQIEDGKVSDDNFNVVDSQDTREFIKSIAKDAHKIGQKEKIYASVMMAQAILESDSGKSSLAQSPNYNLFGVKGSYNGESVNFNTLEAGSDNQMFSINAGFRKYPNLKSSLQDYADLIKNGIEGNPTIYKPTWKSEALTYKEATSHLSHSYATDPNYAEKLNSIIKHYNLTAFDKKRMPNLKKYTQSIGTETSGSDFKPFVEASGSSPYPQGQCTWYVYQRMQQYDSSISGDLGDAHNWNNHAEREGYTVTHSPKNHTAVVFEAGQLGADTQYGHVGFVEKVNDDGSIVISESNVKGLGVISYRTIDAEDANDLDYIQGK